MNPCKMPRGPCNERVFGILIVHEYEQESALDTRRELTAFVSTRTRQSRISEMLTARLETGVCIIYVCVSLG